MRKYLIIFLLSSFMLLNAQHDQKQHSMKHKNVQDHEAERPEIDVEKLDANSDSKLYQCPMDWDIISDEEGNCSVCEMKLKEYTVNEVKHNLAENGFKVINHSKHMDSNEEMKEMHNSKIELNEESTVKETESVQENRIWNKYCPVGGEEVDENSPTVEYNGKIIGFCCPGCDKKFKDDPEKYLGNLSEDGKNFKGKKD